MPHRIVAVLPSARLEPYRNLWLGNGGSMTSDADIAELYAWQVGMCSAWYEVLAYVEVIVRQALDGALRQWNAAQGHGGDWISNPAAPLRGILGPRTLSDWRDSANRAAASRNAVDPDFGPHPRQGEAVCHDDLVAQLSFGNLVHLLPSAPPSPQRRRGFGSGFNRFEQLWIHATSGAFPELSSVWSTGHWARFRPAHPLPAAVEQGYALGAALERLRRIRNRVGHHEQMFRVGHRHRHRDAILVVRAVSSTAADALSGLSRVVRQESLQPRP